MIWNREVWRLVAVIVLVAMTTVLWLFYDFASTYQMFGGGTIAALIHLAAAASTAALAVILIGQLVLQIGFARLLHREPSELQRGLVFAVLGFAALAATLARLGFDLTTILTTSAIITAVIGLSVQPMLASLLSGLAVDRVLRKGDGIVLNGETVEVTALTWRAVVGLRSDGTTVVMPNARLADSTLEILPADRPAAAEISLTLPVAVAPHRLRDAVVATLADFGEVEIAKPVVLQPLGYDRNKGGAVYRVKFWVVHYSQIGATQSAVLHNLWYTLRREGLVPAEDQAAGGGPESIGTAVMTALRAVSPRPPGANAEDLVAAGQLLSYGDRERIVLPARCAGAICLLVSGECVRIGAGGPLLLGGRTQPASTIAEYNLTERGALARIEQLLAERIGPYAEFAVRRAAMHGADLTAVCETVAREIDDPIERDTFMRAANPPREILLGPGLMFRTQRDDAQRIVAEPPLRAHGHAILLAVPEAAFTAAGEPASHQK